MHTVSPFRATELPTTTAMHVPNEAQMSATLVLGGFTPCVDAAYGHHAADPSRAALHQMPRNGCGCVEIRAAAFVRDDIA